MRPTGSFSSTRRDILIRAAAACAASLQPLRAGEFWDKKQPSEWSVEEVQKLKTKSPWAKEVTATMSGGGGGGYGGGMGIPGMGGGRRGGMGGNRRPMAQQVKGTVRWESAQPIIDATRTPFPEAFANRYVVSVNDFPLQQQSRRNSDDSSSSGASLDKLDELKMYTIIQPKGKSNAQAGLVQMVPEGSGNLWFGFSKDMITLSADDKEVEFSTQIGRLMIKAKFDFHAMKYHGKLSV